MIDGPPAQPHFTMKGRSIDKLLRQVEDWHGEFALSQHVDWEEWSSSGLRGYECEEEDEHLGATLRWSVQELCDSWALAEEGQALLPLMSLVEQSQLAVEDLMDVIGDCGNEYRR